MGDPRSTRKNEHGVGVTNDRTREISLRLLAGPASIPEETFGGAKVSTGEMR